MVEKVRVAIFDNAMVLVGSEMVPEAAVGDRIPCGDLPDNGTYKWVLGEKTFYPLGRGFPQVSSKPPHPEHFVLFRIIEVLGNDAPAEAQEWGTWYRENIKQRTEESTRRARAPKV